MHELAFVRSAESIVLRNREQPVKETEVVSAATLALLSLQFRRKWRKLLRQKRQIAQSSQAQLAFGHASRHNPNPLKNRVQDIFAGLWTL